MHDATAVVKWVIYPGCAIQRGSKENILVKEKQMHVVVGQPVQSFPCNGECTLWCRINPHFSMENTNVNKWLGGTN